MTIYFERQITLSELFRRGGDAIGRANIRGLLLRQIASDLHAANMQASGYLGVLANEMLTEASAAKEQLLAVYLSRGTNGIPEEFPVLKSTFPPIAFDQDVGLFPDRQFGSHTSK